MQLIFPSSAFQPSILAADPIPPSVSPAAMSRNIPNSALDRLLQSLGASWG
jgi:hypothetical protein